MSDDVVKGSLFKLAQKMWARRKWLVISVFAASFAAVLSLVTFLPDMYQSTATVLVEREQIPDTVVRPAAGAEVETRLKTISEQILSRSRLQEMINLFGLYPDLKGKTPVETVVEQMRRDIHLEIKGAEGGVSPRTTVAFALSYRGRNPQTVAAVANTLASFYIEENWRTRGRQATEAAEFFKVQLDEMRKRLEEQERQTSEVRRRHPGQLPQQAQANLVTLERLNMQLRLNMERLTRVVERREALAKQLADALPYGSLGGGPGVKGERISKLRQELMELRTRFSDKYPDIIRLKTEIAALEHETGEMNPDGGPRANPEASPTVQRSRQALEEVETEIQSIKGEEKHLEQAITAYQRRIERAPTQEQEFPELLREYETTKDLYSSLLRRYADAQRVESWEARQRGEKFRILDPAVPANHPTAPNRVRLLLMGLAFSFGIAAGAVMLAEQIDSTFHTVDDLRSFTKAPVLVSIPRIATEGDTDRRWQLMRLGLAAATVGLLLIIGASYYIAHENEEMVRLLMRSGRS